MAGPHRGHLSPPELPVLPCPAGAGGTEPARGSLASLPGAGQVGSEGADAAQTPRVLGRGPGARGVSEAQSFHFQRPHPAATALPWQWVQNRPSLGRRSQRKVPGMWQLSPFPAGRSRKWIHWAVQSPSDSSTPWPRLPALPVRCSQNDEGLTSSPFKSEDAMKVSDYYFVKSRANCASNSAPSLV